jgi:predicted AlkP superfamily pyrophosphatase or phosphodiesterase
MEPQIPLKTQWEFKINVDQTFLKFFKKYKAIDVPALSHKSSHIQERKLLKGYFEEKSTIDEYDNLVWKIHEENKKEFLNSVGKFDLLLGYFNIADSIGHLSFGITEKMNKIYKELDKLAQTLKDSNESVLIISDHGMKAVGRYGDHNPNGFYSYNSKLELNLPKITKFYDLIKRDATK